MVDLASSRVGGSSYPSQVCPSTLSPFRYPGGKSWLRTLVISWLRTINRPSVFLEPFAGGASVALAVAELDLADTVELVECDPEVGAVWECALSTTRCRSLASKIRGFHMTRKNALRVLRTQVDSCADRAFRCLLKNRVQHGGVMAEGAGLLRSGEKGRGVRSRWYPETLADRLKRIHELRNRLTFRIGDGIDAIARHDSDERAVVFADPPYSAGEGSPGGRLYPFWSLDHPRLFKLLGGIKGQFLLTYHDSTEVRRLAADQRFAVQELEMRTTHHRRRIELLITKQHVDVFAAKT